MGPRGQDIGSSSPSVRWEGGTGTFFTSPQSSGVRLAPHFNMAGRKAQLLSSCVTVDISVCWVSAVCQVRMKTGLV